MKPNPKLLPAILLCLSALSAPAQNTRPTEDDHQACRDHLAQLFRAIKAFKKANNGKLPRLMSDMYPRFISDTNAIVCPFTRRTGIRRGGIRDGKVRNSYHYEFSPGKIPKVVQGAFGESDLSMAEWKTLQMELIGDELPMIRCFNHPRSINLTYGGEVRESHQIWEGDYSDNPLKELSPSALLKKFGKLESAAMSNPRNVTKRWNRSIGNEPTYQSTPQYCLLTFGHGAERVWMVEDDRRLFVDQNANGDLTDDGPPILPSKFRKLDTKSWDFHYELDAITTPSGVRHTNLVLRRWNYNDPADKYGLSISVRGKRPMYAGWAASFWSNNRKQAPVIDFDAPLTPTLLRDKEITIGDGLKELHFGFFNQGSGKGTEARLSEKAIPPSLIPRLIIEWPTTGNAKLRSAHKLTERCCYWHYYLLDLEIPEGVVPGTAYITFLLPGGVEGIDLKTRRISVPVVKPK